MQNTITVGLGELKISRDPQDVLVAYGLGSCLGIGFYDPRIHLAGLLHALLPNHPNDLNDQNPRYVDTGIRTLLAQMIEAGAERSRIVIRMAGGANMLVAPGFTNSFTIGTRNVETAYATFSQLKLSLASQEVGGTIGRTVRFYIPDGRMTIRTMGNQEREF
jgi:chemotaxis protein CheD